MLTDETRETMGLFWKVPAMMLGLALLGLFILGLVELVLE